MEIDEIKRTAQYFRLRMISILVLKELFYIFTKVICTAVTMYVLPLLEKNEIDVNNVYEKYLKSENICILIAILSMYINFT